MHRRSSQDSFAPLRAFDRLRRDERRWRGSCETRVEIGLEGLEERVFLSAGMLDPMFGDGGRAVLGFPSPNRDGAITVIEQPDGKLVAVGWTDDGTARLALTRYNPDGTLDSSFGTEGRSRPDIRYGSAAVMDSAGRLVVVGSDYTTIALARFNPDGSLDPSFGIDGQVVTDFGLPVSASAVTIDSAGRFVVAGSVNYYLSENTDFLVARFTPSGALDTSFGGLGAVSLNFHHTIDYYGHHYSNDVATAIAIDSSGRLVVGGNTSSGFSDFALARFLSNGTLDTSFGGGAGGVWTNFWWSAYAWDPWSGYYRWPSRDSIRSIAIDPSDGGIIAMGTASGPSATDFSVRVEDFAVVRYRSDGQLDSAFDGDGLATIDFGGSTDTLAAGMVDSAGRVVVVGTARGYQAYPELAVARFDRSTGALDTAFDGDGRSLIAFPDPTGWVEIYGARIDSAGRVIAVGEAPRFGSGVTSDFALARCLADGSLDSSFGAGGWAATGFLGGAADYPLASALQPDNKVLVVLASYSSVSNSILVARYNPDGTLDPSFGTGGVADLGVDVGFWWWPNSIAVDHAGRIVIGGSRDSFGYVAARLTSNGTFDSSFGSGGVATVVFEGSYFDYGYSMAVDANDRVILAGYTISDFGEYAMGIARLTASGSLDPSFGGDGRVWTDLSEELSQSYAADVAVDEAGRVVVLGVSSSYSSSGQQLAVVRYNPDGTFDESFGTGGKVMRAASADIYSYPWMLAVDPRGRIVVGASDFDYATYISTSSLMRYNGDGSEDVAFGSGGTLILPDNLSPSFAVDSDSRIVVSASGSFGVARYTEAGVLDVTFGIEGVATADFGSGAQESAWWLLTDNQGDIVAVGASYGWSSFPNYYGDVLLAKFQGEEAVPTANVVSVDVGRDLRSIIIAFDGPVDAAQAVNAANYLLTASGGDSNGDGDLFNDGDEAALPIVSITYDAATHTVVITTGAVVFDDDFRVSIDGDGAASDGTLGLALVGGDFTADLDMRSLSLAQDLLDRVEALGISTGTSKSIISRMENVVKMLGRDDPNEGGVIALLQSVIIGINHWYERGGVSALDRDRLIADANEIILGLTLL